MARVTLENGSRVIRDFHIDCVTTKNFGRFVPNVPARLLVFDSTIRFQKVWALDVCQKLDGYYEARALSDEYMYSLCNFLNEEGGDAPLNAAHRGLWHAVSTLARAHCECAVCVADRVLDGLDR